MTILEFVNKWKKSKLSERSAAQSHFIDLCEVLDQDSPTSVDGEGDTYTFEKGIKKNCGGNGFADVWKRHHFAWEYKGKHKDLAEAYQQLLTYREALENPPLLVVCDFEQFEIHTNYTNTSPEIYAFTLDGLLKNEPTASCKFRPLQVLNWLFTKPAKLRPGRTTEEVTTDAAQEFGKLAQSLRDRGVSAEASARYIMRLLFCLFSEGVGLLPNRVFTRTVEQNRHKPAEFVRKVRNLFGEMSKGGSFGADDIPYFDGGLFMDDEAHELTEDDLGILVRAARLNWAAIEPAIFGTLFERILDPNKRAQIGAHYTSKEDILLVVEPVLMEPLRRKWAAVQQQINQALANANGRLKAKKAQQQISELLRGFAAELANVRVLDPACGSGNFLYVALKRLLDLEKEISVFANSIGISQFFIQCRPHQLYGIESNIYAHEVASVAVWIGFLQWQRDNYGVIITSDPVMHPLENVRCMDAVLTHDKKGTPVQPDWPEVEVIIGNPPFLGGNKIRKELGDEYVDDLFRLYEGRVPAFCDFVCYWFERTRQQIELGKANRAGLLATQSIRGGVNRTVLDKIKESGKTDIFWAQSDREWTLDGAMVHVSMIGFDDGNEKTRTLDDKPVACINSDLTAGVSVVSARALQENARICFMGASPKGPFDIPEDIAMKMLQAPININNRPNSDVVRPVATAVDLVQRARRVWTIDFRVLDRKSAAQYEKPFQYVLKHVYPIRSRNRRKVYAERWWIYAEARPGMRKALQGLTRYIATPAVSKHRIYVWVLSEVLCNQGTLVFARDDDYFFGVLQSRIHEIWARRKGTQLREAESGFRYTPTTTFETFPLPFPPGQEPKSDARIQRIAATARELVKKRDMWLNPPGASETELKKRTLTNLYNQNPTWLQDAHRALDAAVLTAYGWRADISDDEILSRLLVLNAERFAKQAVQAELEYEPAQPKQPRKPAGSVLGEKKIARDEAQDR